MANNHIRPITNALTIDVEDYFQVHALSHRIRYDDWEHIPSHVEKNTYKILDLLDSQQSAVSGQPQPTQLTRSAAGGLDFLPFIRIGRNKKKSSKSSESCLTSTMEYEGITHKIIGAAYQVYNQLGFGFLESVCKEAMIIELIKDNLKFEAEKPLKVFYDGQIVGDFYVDLFVEDEIIVELKSVHNLAKEHACPVKCLPRSMLFLFI